MDSSGSRPLLGGLELQAGNSYAFDGCGTFYRDRESRLALAGIFQVGISFY
jgi:hypothetical protein